MITNKIINDLVKYFESKENPTDEEKEFLYQFKLYNDAFPITSVTRDDLAERGFDAEKITDSQMNRLAEKMGDDYCENLFWDSMEILAETMGFPVKED